MKKIIIYTFVVLSLFLIGFFVGRYDLQEKLKFARIQTTQNVLLIGDVQCEEKLREVLKQIEKPKNGWFL